jgi:multisubunit Na+/H+ antiporter MnhB subunit
MYQIFNNNSFIICTAICCVAICLFTIITYVNAKQKTFDKLKFIAVISSLFLIFTIINYRVSETTSATSQKTIYTFNNLEIIKKTSATVINFLVKMVVKKY